MDFAKQGEGVTALESLMNDSGVDIAKKAFRASPN